MTALVRERFDAHVERTQWIGSGAWSDCFAFTSQGRDLVLRIGRFGDDFWLDEYVQRYDAPELPIPRTHVVAAIGSEFFAVSDFVSGQPLEQISPWLPIVPATASLLEALRQTSTRDLVGWGYWTPVAGGQSASWREFLLSVDQDPPESRMHGWQAQLATSEQATDGFGRGYELLRTTIADEIPRSLVHNDLLNRNVHAGAATINGVFDWGNSLLGDHLYDLAHWCFWEPWLTNIQAEPLLAALRARWASQHETIEHFDERLRGCALHIALGHIAYHSFRTDWHEVQRIIDRLDVVATYQW